MAWRGLGWLATRYQVRFTRRIFRREAYLAGDDASRRDELQCALDEPDVDAIVCTRGGYGLSRFVHELDWTSFRSRPKWVVGFSDVTALHVEIGRQGVSSVHGPNLTGYGRADGRARAALVDLLEHPTVARTWGGLRTLARGRAQGPIVGGNLSMLHACAVAGRLAVPAGAIVLLEDVGERPYRIDRMITTLLVGGHLDSVAGVVLGEFEGCAPGPDGRSAEQVLAERIGALPVPVTCGLPVGHGLRNEPVALGATAELEATDEMGSLRIAGA